MESNKKTKFLYLFNLAENYSYEELKEAYRILVQVWHPDKHNSNDKLREKADDKIKEIYEGYEYLKNNLNEDCEKESYKSNSKSDYYDVQSESNKDGGNEEGEFKKNGTPKNTYSPQKPVKSSSNDIIVIIITIIILFLFISISMWVVNQDKLSVSSLREYEEVIEEPPKPTLVDIKNGYKKFHFRMTVSDAKKIQKPSKINKIKRNDIIELFYDKGNILKIGEYKINFVELKFFKNLLYRIDLGFSSYQQQIYKTFVSAYGRAKNNNSWTRGEHKLRAKSWDGLNVLCTILAEINSPEKTGWDAIVIYDKALYKSALEYEENEPERASVYIHSDGLKNIRLKMNISDFVKLFNPRPKIENLGFKQKTIFISNPKAYSIGYYPIENIKGYFFKNSLYRIDVDFIANREKIFKAFMSRFPSATVNNSWTSGQQKITAMEYVNSDNVSSILASKSNNPQWEKLIFYSLSLMKEKNKFENEAPQRAADDL